MEKEMTLNQLANKMDQRFDGLEKRFEGIDQQFVGIEKRFEGIDQRFDGMDQRFDGMEKRFGEMDQRFDGMEKRFGEMDQQFVGIEKRLGNVENKVDGIATDLEDLAIMTKMGFDDLGEKVDANTKSISVLSHRVGKLQDKSLDHDVRIRRLERAQPA